MSCFYTHPQNQDQFAFAMLEKYPTQRSMYLSDYKVVRLKEDHYQCGKGLETH
jgi:hypothetical protein